MLEMLWGYRDRRDCLPRGRKGKTPLAMHWVSLRFILGYWFIIRFLHVLSHPLMEHHLYVLSLFSGLETSAKKKALQEGRGLTSPLLVPGQVPGLQDESRGRILQSLRQEPSSWKMAYFNSIGMFMHYMEKNLNIDSS